MKKGFFFWLLGGSVYAQIPSPDFMLFINGMTAKTESSGEHSAVDLAKFKNGQVGVSSLHFPSMAPEREETYHFFCRYFDKKMDGFVHDVKSVYLYTRGFSKTILTDPWQQFLRHAESIEVVHSLKSEMKRGEDLKPTPLRVDALSTHFRTIMEMLMTNPNLKTLTIKVDAYFLQKKEWVQDLGRLIRRTPVPYLVLEFGNFQERPVVNLSFLAEELQQGSTLEGLEIKDCALLNVKALAEALQKNPQLKRLRLYSCDFEHISDLIILLSRNSSLEELDLRESTFKTCTGQEDLPQAFEGLWRQPSRLSILKLDYTNFLHKNPQWAGEILKIWAKKLKVLSLRQTSLPREAAEQLAQVLPESPLRELDLSRNQLQGDFLLKKLLESSSLQKLDLSDNAFKGSQEDFLTSRSTLQELDFSHNPLGDTGVQNLAKGLSQNPSLRKLGLDSVKMKDLTALGQALKVNTHLEELILSDDHIEDLRPLEKALAQNSTLKKFWLFGSLKLKDLSPLGRGLCQNKGLQELRINGHMEVQDISSLAHALGQNRTLTSLSLEGNNVHDLGPLKDLASNTSLLKLDISFNPVESILPLVEALKVNQGLRELNLEYCWSSSPDSLHELERLAHALAENKGLKTLILGIKCPTKIEGRSEQALLDLAKSRPDLKIFW